MKLKAAASDGNVRPHRCHSLANLSVVLKIDKLQILTLPPLTLEVDSGACLAVEGPSGSGKSRLLRAIADLDPAEGEVYLDGVERAAFTPAAWRAAVRYVAAEPGWWLPTAGAHFKTQTSARNFARLFGVDERRLAADVATLSTGERQRLAIARALEDDPAVLLLDEPTAALDDDATAAIESEIQRRLAAGVVVLIASHDSGQIDRLADARLQLAAPSSSFPRTPQAVS